MTNEKKPPQLENNENPINIDGAPVESALGLDTNIAALFCYLFLGIGGLIFLMIEKQNKQIRFSAVQSIVYALSLLIFFVIYSTFSAILNSFVDIWEIINSVLLPLFTIGFFSVWLILMYKSYQNQEWELPLIGKIARSFSK